MVVLLNLIAGLSIGFEFYVDEKTKEEAFILDLLLVRFIFMKDKSR